MGRYCVLQRGMPHDAAPHCLWHLHPQSLRNNASVYHPITQTELFATKGQRSTLTPPAIPTPAHTHTRVDSS